MTSTNPTDDPSLDVNAAREGEDEGKSGKGESGKGKSGRGEGTSGSVGLPVVAPLSTEMLKKVMEVWRRIGGEELAQEMTDFFGEKLRASANCVVTFSGKAFAVVNWAVDAGKQYVADFARNRGRGADAKGLRPGQKAGLGRKPSVQPGGMNGPAGMNGPTGN